MHPLDNVIWKALTTRQAEFAESQAQARRFIPEVTSLAGFNEPTAEGYESLKGLLQGRATIALFLAEAHQPRAGWELVASAPLLQMIYANGNSTAATGSDPELVQLSAKDSPEMIELTAL